MKQLDAKQCIPISGATNNLKRIVICRCGLFAFSLVQLMSGFRNCVVCMICTNVASCMCVGERMCVCVCVRVCCVCMSVLYNGCSCCIYGRTLACVRRSRGCYQYTCMVFKCGYPTTTMRAAQTNVPQHGDEYSPHAGLADKTVQRRRACVVGSIHVYTGKAQLIHGRDCTRVVELASMVNDDQVKKRPRMRIAYRDVTSALCQLSYLRGDMHV